MTRFRGKGFLLSERVARDVFNGLWRFRCGVEEGACSFVYIKEIIRQ